MSVAAQYAHPPPPAPSSKQRHSPYDRPSRSSPRVAAPTTHSATTHGGSSSPSASCLNRSGVSTPPVVRRSPPPAHTQHPQQQPHQYAVYDPRASPVGYMYAHPLPPPAHYCDPQQQYAQQPYGGYVPYPLPGTMLTTPQGGGGGAGPAMQLSDRVRRRCFNCCTTDTSTWRRSTLSPGKVLCNKCGLFERTHSRPRPEQFPHKRGPLASSTSRSRSPTQAQPHPQNHPLAGPGYAPPSNTSTSAAPPSTSQSSSIAPHNRSRPDTPNTADGVASRPASRDGRDERRD
ncbi:hypothetical protein DFH06DRAFT_1238229 [Mycena polygramma]|nr:hypothetical protein DFH06DRAFT_1238229 [Mycena polygramma]